MKKLIAITIVFLIAVSMVSTGAWAFFTDTETSNANLLAAGTLDLKTNDDDGVSATITSSNLKPNNSIGPSVIILRNAGSTAGATLDIVFGYEDSDGEPNPTPISADDTAAILEVTTLTLGSTNLLTSVTDHNENGWKDVEDLKYFNFTGLEGLDADTSKEFVITIKMCDGIDNSFQADGIIITMTFTLKQ